MKHKYSVWSLRKIKVLIFANLCLYCVDQKFKQLSLISIACHLFFSEPNDVFRPRWPTSLFTLHQRHRHREISRP